MKQQQQSKPKSKVGQWLKNSGKGFKEIFADWFMSQPLFTIVGDEIKLIKEENRQKKRTPQEKKKLKDQILKMKDDAIQKYVDQYRSETDRDLKADIKETFNSFLNTIKTGNLNDQKKINFFEDDEDIMELFADIENNWDDDEGVGESYNEKGVNMKLIDIRNEYLKTIRMHAIAENDTTLAGPVPEVSTAIQEVEDKIGHMVDFCDSEPTNELFAAVKTEKTKNQIMDQLKTLITNISRSETEITDAYKEQLANEIVALFVVKSEFDARDLFESPAKEIVEELTNDTEEISEISPEVGGLVKEKTEPIIDSLNKVQDELTYKPVDDEDGQVIVDKVKTSDELIPAAELVGKSEAGLLFEDSTKYSMPLQRLGLFGGVLGVTGSIASVISMLVAAPINLYSMGKLAKLEKEFGSALTIRQPLIATDDLSKEIIATYSKYVESDTAIKIRQILASSIAKFDGGSLMKRSKDVLSDKFTEMNQETRDGKNRASKDKYAQIMSAFSQSADIMNLYSCVLRRNMLEGSFIHNIQSMTTRGEVGEFINDNRHSPTSTIEVEVMYKDMKNITDFSANTNTKKASVTVDVAGRKLPYDDILNTFLDMNTKYFGDVKVTPQEKNTEKVAKGAIKLIKTKGTKEEKKALSSNKFTDIINKIENVKTPLFHVMLSLQAYHELKDNGMDLKDANTYSKVMKRLPIVSIAIVDEDSEIVTASSGIHKNYTDIPFKQLEGEISRYEKELQAMVKFGMQR